MWAVPKQNSSQVRKNTEALTEIQKFNTLSIEIYLKEKLQQISQTGHGHKILKKNIKKLHVVEQIAAKEGKELQKKRRELQAKLKSQKKKVDYFERAKHKKRIGKKRRKLQAKLKSQEMKVDYFERAKRLEEIPLLQANMKERQLQDQQFWEQQEKERIAAAIEERKLAVATRDRLARMKPDKDEFLEKLEKERNIVYEDKLKDFEKTLHEERQKRLLERKLKRKEERHTRYIKEKEEEEKRKLAEQKRKEEEERERAKRKEQEKKLKEQLEMLDRTGAKQRQRLEEIEKRLAEAKKRTIRDKVKDSSWRN